MNKYISHDIYDFCDEFARYDLECMDKNFLLYNEELALYSDNSLEEWDKYKNLLVIDIYFYIKNELNLYCLMAQLDSMFRLLKVVRIKAYGNDYIIYKKQLDGMFHVWGEWYTWAPIDFYGM